MTASWPRRAQTDGDARLSKSGRVDAYASPIATLDVTAVRALLFDLGGVVITLDFQRVFARWALAAGCDAAFLAGRFSQDDAYVRHERGEIDAAGYFASLRSTLGIELSDEQFLDGWNDIYPGPVDGMEALLRTASYAFPLYAFTNSNPSHQSVWSTMLQLELTWFRSVFVSSELGMRKPDREAYLEVAARTGHRASEFLFFDDSPENVEGARAAGIQAVLTRSIADVRRALRALGVGEAR
jgi:HAD superfamily hydrolase (TIGR01509 family)